MSEKPLTVRKKMERVAARVGLRLVITPIRLLTFQGARALGRCIGANLYRFSKRYRTVALKNLTLVYGHEWGAERVTRTAREVFVHFGQMAAEFIKLPRLSAEQVNALATVTGRENLDAALAAGRGVLLVTGHFGNWEFMARWLAVNGYKLCVVARRANDPVADRLLYNTRSQSGAEVYSRGNSARSVLQSLKRNDIVALLPDQNAADVFVPFMGFSTGTVDGPAIIHLKTKAPLLFSWCVRTEENRFSITFEPPETIEATGDKHADIARVMALVNARLEAMVRRYPNQWLWLHDRWKASPGVFPDGEEQARLLNTPINKMDDARSASDHAAR